MKVGEICEHILTGRLFQIDSTSKKTRTLLSVTSHRKIYFEVTETSIAMISMISTLGVVQICRPTT